jgi:Tol biopolymer transport system component
VPDGGEVLHLYDLRRKTFAAVPGSAGLWTARWSPDGRYIAALTIDREQRMKLFDTVTKRWRALAAIHVNNPSWSRDSAFVYFDIEGGGFALRRVGVADGQVEELTPIDFALAVPSWSGLALDDSPIVLRNRTAPTIYALTLERGR